MVCVHVCVCYWPPVRDVCPNHEVVMFQPRAVTTPKPRLCHLLLYSLLLNPHQPLLLPSDVLLGGNPTPAPPPHLPTFTLSLHGIIRPPGRHLFKFQHTNKTSPPSHPSLSDSDSSSPPSHPFSPLHLPDSCRCRSLNAAKISSNVALSYFSAVSCLPHGSRSLPPPL